MTGELYLALNALVNYRGLLNLKLIQSYMKMLRGLYKEDAEEAVSGYAEVYHELCNEGCNSIGDYLLDKVLYTPNPYAASLQNEAGVRHDIGILNRIVSTSCIEIKSRMRLISNERFGRVISELPNWQNGPELDFEYLKRFYKEIGCGVFAKYKAFNWKDGALHPVENPDKISHDAMIGYTSQRNEVIRNTRALMEGKYVNNVLLYGDSGTGKSATVKALINMPEFERLRLIHVRKEDISELDEIIRLIKEERYKFILFIDDISFSGDERSYAALKEVLEGGIAVRPGNTAIYATSNRRNLVAESFSEREGDDIHRNETIQSKISLAARFGIRIAFLPMDLNAFLDFTQALAKMNGVNMDAAAVRSEAVKWSHYGRTARTARQLVDYLRTMI